MFMKHIGKINDKKVAVVYKTVPDQDHMALVLYTETLPRNIHDDVMRVIESPEGQEANELSDVLFRNLLSDGRPILETIHKEGMLKKVECKQVIITPNASSHVRLDELNRLISEMESGDDARSKLQDLDANAGLVDPNNKASSALGDSAIAKQQLDQATKMEAESKSLLAESKRLKAEAYKLDASLKPKRGRKPSVKKKAKAKA